ncbi:MAG: sigma-70 family RNA polymerase sigma factor [Chloroflexota bacterium]
MRSDQDSPNSDERLIRSAASGDIDAYAEIYQRYLKPIYKYIFYRVSDVGDAEDLTEEVFLRVWDRLQKSGGETGIKNFSAWLYRTAHNLVVDFYRSSSLKNRQDFPAEEVADPESSTEEIIAKKMESTELETAIRSLKEPLQQIIILRFINGLSHAETGEILGLKPGHVRVLQYRALKKLRASLEKDSRL